MADEITEYVYLSASKDGLNVQSDASLAVAKKLRDLSGTAGAKFTQSFLHTADSALVIPADIGTPARLLIENLDATNKVTLSTGTGGAFGTGFAEIDAEGRMYYKPVGTVYIQATNATVQLQVTVLPA